MVHLKMKNSIKPMKGNMQCHDDFTLSIRINSSHNQDVTEKIVKNVVDGGDYSKEWYFL